ncbi:S41 family peptidase [Fulvivirga lutimaris]|uniref:S41 family peptidase n=1 Tax=Fulvivirga lutimaris TaxID=1819566 RepID=UPI0012BB608C|nr:S41 family peptidase [Fulvivirga lutimaris]MTI39252.1 peptidase S41 [Fulvivirga lutimaris]
MSRICIILIVVVAGLWSCDRILLGEEIPNSAVANFESLWQEFDEKYGLFRVKQINWDSVHSIYKPQVMNVTSEEDLYFILTSMLAILNDSHVALLPDVTSKLPFYQSGVLGKLDSMTDFNLEIVKTSYLKEMKFEEPFFTYGILNNNIGYIHIEGFSDLPKFLEDPMDHVLTTLADTEGLVIDVRGGYGGEDIAGQYIAGRFANITEVYMRTRVKSGPQSDDFSEFQNWSLKPEGDFQYTKPIVVLTNRFTISARETFCLAMKVLPHVTFVGDTTAGAFSNQINRELPNGWGYSMSIGEWVDGSGYSYEGVGLIPNILVKNKKEDLLNGKDEALDKAMELLN